MKTRQTLRFYLCGFGVALLFLCSCGCASMCAHKTESLLSTAGFRAETPSNPQQCSCCDALPPYQLQRLEKNGKVIYAYADKKAGLVYVGGENEFQRFQQLGLQKKIADEQMQAAAMNQDAGLAWTWGPPGVVW